MNSFPFFSSSTKPKPPRPPIIKRAALPPWPNPTAERGNQLIWTDGLFNKDIITIPDSKFLLGNFCGLRNFVYPPANDAPAFFSFLLDRLPLELQHKFLYTYASFGYNTVQQSVYQQRIENNQSLDQFIATQKLIQSYGLKNDIWWIGGRDEGGAPIQVYIKSFNEWYDELIRAKAMDKSCVGWQLDASFHPRQLQEVIEWMSAKCKPAGIPLACHWENDSCSLFDGKDDAYENTIASMHPDPSDPLHALYSSTLDNWRNWHVLNNRFIDYHHLQLDIWGPILGVQKAIQVLLGATNVCFTEYCAQSSFEGKTTEDYGDLMGRAALGASGGPFKLVGLYNGSRNLDGTALYGG